MSEYNLVSFNGDLSAEDKSVMVEGMLAYHASKGHPRTSEVFSIVIRGEAEKLLGCVVATVLWNGMEIQTLWIDESIRNQGWGRKLMEAAEEEAIKRGCTLAYTNTFTWQAPEFYKKIGYEIYGKLDDFPVGNSLFYFRKHLM